MESSKMKNMVILRNLPSNMVEEAIIIFKESKKVKQKEFVEKGSKANFSERESKSKEYILDEAEMIIKDYINQIESKKKIVKNVKDKKMLRYCIVSTTLLVISIIINFI
ncbi:MAG: hypothetical protein HFJ55_03085 [Clostridia bacterium]|nr:hypothetical protein [Clostridia bacterium]